MADVADSVITKEMEAAIGVESAPVTVEVTTTGIRMYARAVGYTDPIFYDEAAARAEGYRGLVAPPGFVGTPIYRPDGPGLEAMMGGLDIPYRWLLDGGVTFERVEPIVAGDVLTSRSRITEFRERVGAVGPMLIVFRETVYTREDGTAVARSRSNLIHY
jgi:acyl dehydratase